MKAQFTIINNDYHKWKSLLGCTNREKENSMRETLKQVKIEKHEEKDKIWVVATDGFVLMKLEIDVKEVKWNEEVKTFLLPQEIVKTLANAKSVKQIVTITVEKDNRIVVKTDNITTEYEAQGLNYPDYQKIIPLEKETNTKIKLNPNLLKPFTDLNSMKIVVLEFETAITPQNGQQATKKPIRIYNSDNQFLGLIMPCSFE